MSVRAMLLHGCEGGTSKRRRRSMLLQGRGGCRTCQP